MAISATESSTAVVNGLSTRPFPLPGNDDSCRDILLTSSDEAQEHRRKLLKGQSILIVQGGYEDKGFIYEKLRELGVKVTIIDSQKSAWQSAANLGKISDFIPWDAAPSEGGEDAMYESAMRAIGNRKFDAVTTYYEDAVTTAARVASAIGVAVNEVEASLLARNKLCTRAAMARAGLPVPRFHRISCASDIEAACLTVGFPAILKPAFGAASMGVTRVESLNETQAAYRKIASTLDVKNDGIWAHGSDMLLEEFYDGDEFDVDMLLSGGESVYAKVSDNWDCLPPWFQEMGTNCPSLYPESKQQELIELAERTTLALGFANGCFHVELKYTNRGARIIEVNARMGGVSVREVNLVSWGVDLVEEHAMAALGIPIRPVVPAQPLRFIAECAVNAPFSGVINADDWLEFTKEDSRVYKIKYFKKKGDAVVGPEEGVPDWIVEVLAVSQSSQQEAVDVVRRIVTEKAPVPITAKVRGSEMPYYFPSNAHPFVLEESNNNKG